MNTAAVIVFARAPRAGATKTRLIPALGAAGAAQLYEQLLARTLLQVAVLPDVARMVYVDVPSAGDYFRARLALTDWDIEVQQGSTLGARMAHALDQALRRHAHVILIGSDIVDFKAIDLAQALQALARGNEVVLGPAADGGYWLVGLGSPQPALFTDIPWGSAQVYGDTVARLMAQGTRWSKLRECHDIDRPADLARHAAALAELLPHSALLAGELRAKLLDTTGLARLKADKAGA